MNNHSLMTRETNSTINYASETQLGSSGGETLLCTIDFLWKDYCGFGIGIYSNNVKIGKTSIYTYSSWIVASFPRQFSTAGSALAFFSLYVVVRS